MHISKILPSKHLLTFFYTQNSNNTIAFVSHKCGYLLILNNQPNNPNLQSPLLKGEHQRLKGMLHMDPKWIRKTCEILDEGFSPCNYKQPLPHYNKITQEAQAPLLTYLAYTLSVYNSSEGMLCYYSLELSLCPTNSLMAAEHATY